MRYLCHYVILKFASQSEALGGVAGKRCLVLGSLILVIDFKLQIDFSSLPVVVVPSASGCLPALSAVCWVLRLLAFPIWCSPDPVAEIVTVFHFVLFRKSSFVCASVLLIVWLLPQPHAGLALRVVRMDFFQDPQLMCFAPEL